jgi:hypothetical protein
MPPADALGEYQAGSVANLQARRGLASRANWKMRRPSRPTVHSGIMSAKRSGDTTNEQIEEALSVTSRFRVEYSDRRREHFSRRLNVQHFRRGKLTDFRKDRIVEPIANNDWQRRLWQSERR